ncbi:MAG: HPr(Ser) kinase/phosphatase [Thermodesulfobacteriota bacterium]
MPKSEERQENLTVREFAHSMDLGLQFEILQAGKGMSNRISSPRIQKLGLALAGYTDYIHPERVQMMGGSEMNYLSALPHEAYRNALNGLKKARICCIVVTRNLEVSADLLQVAREAGIPLLRTKALSSGAMVRITTFLERRLAPRTTVHGVFMDVFGLGILLLGPSGIGKSECALELVLKGHRLVTDDAVEITRRGIDRLVGAGGPVLKYHMELRGLGIINIKELFGISATGHSQTLDLVVRLERWKPDGECDRLGVDRSTIEFLGVSVPLIEMPVAPGRNVATLVEVSARIHLLRQRGYQPSKELLDTQIFGSSEHNR